MLTTHSEGPPALGSTNQKKWLNSEEGCLDELCVPQEFWAEGEEGGKINSLKNQFALPTD